jgi:hypothetical protein
MSKQKKGLLVQILGLPNSGKISRSNYVVANLAEQYKIHNFGNLGGMSMPEIIKKPWIFYEFGLIDANKERYGENEMLAENKAKMQDELEIYEEIFENNIKPLLNENEIVVGFNPIIQNVIHRLKTLYPNETQFQKIKTKIDKLHSKYNTMETYLDATPSQVIARQPIGYQTRLATENVMRELENAELLERLNLLKVKRKKFIKRYEDELKANHFLKDIYKTKNVMEYLGKARHQLLNYSHQNNILTMSHDLNSQAQNEVVLEYVLKIIEDNKIRVSQPKSL